MLGSYKAHFLKLDIWAKGESNGCCYFSLLPNFTVDGNKKEGIKLIPGFCTTQIK
jgi:hypothetical protein